MSTYTFYYNQDLPSQRKQQLLSKYINSYPIKYIDGARNLAQKTELNQQDAQYLYPEEITKAETLTSQIPTRKDQQFTTTQQDEEHKAINETKSQTITSNNIETKQPNPKIPEDNQQTPFIQTPTNEETYQPVEYIDNSNLYEENLSPRNYLVLNHSQYTNGNSTRLEKKHIASIEKINQSRREKRQEEISHLRAVPQIDKRSRQIAESKRLDGEKTYERLSKITKKVRVYDNPEFSFSPRINARSKSLKRTINDLYKVPEKQNSITVTTANTRFTPSSSRVKLSKKAEQTLSRVNTDHEG